MVAANLIPGHRLRAKARRARIRLWIGVCAAYGSLLTTATALSPLAVAREDSHVRRQLEQAQSRISQFEAEIAADRRELAAHLALLDANRAIGDRPDWSILLRAVAERVGDDVALGEFRLERVSEAERAGPGPAGRQAGSPRGALQGYLMAVSGFARTPGAVSQLVLKLEQTGLFATVTLVKSTAEPFLADQATAFRIHCVLNWGGGSKT